MAKTKSRRAKPENLLPPPSDDYLVHMELLDECQHRLGNAQTAWLTAAAAIPPDDGGVDAIGFFDSAQRAASEVHTAGVGLSRGPGVFSRIPDEWRAAALEDVDHAMAAARMTGLAMSSVLGAAMIQTPLAPYGFDLPGETAPELELWMQGKVEVLGPLLTRASLASMWAPSLPDEDPGEDRDDGDRVRDAVLGPVDSALDAIYGRAWQYVYESAQQTGMPVWAQDRYRLDRGAAHYEAGKQDEGSFDLDRSKLEALARRIHKAVARYGTDEVELMSALANLDRREISALKEIYATSFREDLPSHVLADVSGEDDREASAKLSGDPVEAALAALENMVDHVDIVDGDVANFSGIEAVLRALPASELERFLERVGGGEGAALVERILGAWSPDVNDEDKQVVAALFEGDLARADALRMREAIDSGRADKVLELLERVDVAALLRVWPDMSASGLTLDIELHAADFWKPGQRDMMFALLIGDRTAYQAAKLYAVHEGSNGSSDLLDVLADPDLAAGPESPAYQEAVSRRERLKHVLVDRYGVTAAEVVDGAFSDEHEREQAAELLEMGKARPATLLIVGMLDLSAAKMTAALRGLSKAEVEAVKEELEALGYDEVLGKVIDLAGDTAELELLLEHGAPTTTEERLAVGKARYGRQRGDWTEPVVDWVEEWGFGTDRGEILDHHYIQMWLAARRNDDAAVELWYSRLEGQSQDYEAMRKMVANAIAMGLEVSAAAVATVATSSMASPWLARALVAIAGGAVAIASKKAVLGDSYSFDDITSDVVIQAISAGVSGGVAYKLAAGGSSAAAGVATLATRAADVQQTLGPAAARKIFEGVVQDLADNVTEDVLTAALSGETWKNGLPAGIVDLVLGAARTAGVTLLTSVVGGVFGLAPRSPEIQKFIAETAIETLVNSPDEADSVIAAAVAALSLGSAFVSQAVEDWQQAEGDERTAARHVLEERLAAEFVLAGMEALDGAKTQPAQTAEIEAYLARVAAFEQVRVREILEMSARVDDSDIADMLTGGVGIDEADFIATSRDHGYRNQRLGKIREMYARGRRISDDGKLSWDWYAIDPAWPDGYSTEQQSYIVEFHETWPHREVSNAELSTRHDKGMRVVDGREERLTDVPTHQSSYVEDRDGSVVVDRVEWADLGQQGLADQASSSAAGRQRDLSEARGLDGIGASDEANARRGEARRSAEKMGEAAARAIGADRYPDYVEVVDSGSGRIDVYLVHPETGHVVAIEAKGAGGQKGDRQGVGAYRVEQGTLEYLAAVVTERRDSGAWDTGHETDGHDFAVYDAVASAMNGDSGRLVYLEVTQPVDQYGNLLPIEVREYELSR